jgi:hypothetical protein
MRKAFSYDVGTLFDTSYYFTPISDICGV